MGGDDERIAFPMRRWFPEVFIPEWRTAPLPRLARAERSAGRQRSEAAARVRDRDEVWHPGIGQRLRRSRPAVEPALAVVDAESAQGRGLVGGLDALGDHAD